VLLFSLMLNSPLSLTPSTLIPLINLTIPDALVSIDHSAALKFFALVLFAC
jgi:hypothetical protein